MTTLALSKQMTPPAVTDDPAEEVAESRAPFVTHLRLSPAQEEALSTFVEQRIAEVKKEMGWREQGTVEPGSWLDHRTINQQTYDNDLSWRPARLGGVFATKGGDMLTRGMTPRFVKELSAKIADDVVGTSPFFGAVKRKTKAGQMAKALEDMMQRKIDESNVQSTLREAIRVALIRNEAVVKQRIDRRLSRYVGPAKVMVDAVGVPVKTSDGLLIYENDDFTVNPATGEAVLQKDPEVQFLAGPYTYEFFPEIEQVQIICNTVEASVLDFRSFLCPLKCKSVHDADINVHLFDVPESTLSQYGGFEQYDRYRDYCATQSGEQVARMRKGEREDGAESGVVKMVALAEVYLRFDANEDGEDEEIFLVYDPNHQRVVWYEYLYSVMEKRPFDVIVGLEKEPNRWYGIGLIQALEPQNNYVDAQFVRINGRDSREASATFMNPHACKEWKNGLPPELGTNKIYTLEQGFDQTTNPPLFRINLNEEISKVGFELMEAVMQDATLQYGVIGGAKEASAVGANTSRTATGILSNERTANVLTRATEAEMYPGIEGVLEQFVSLTLDNMTASELMLDEDGLVLATLSREEARGIEREVKLLLTRSRSSDAVNIDTVAIQKANEYMDLVEMNPRRAKGLRQFYIQMLKNLEVPDPDAALPEVTDADIAAWQQRISKADPNAVKQLMNYKDAPPFIRRQIEAEAGYQPATGQDHATEIALRAKEAAPEPAPQPSAK